MSLYSIGRCRLLVVLLCSALAAAVRADDWPTIRAIEFEGNHTTRASTMLRETTVRVGDAADPRAIERSRQAIQDLGLFKAVSVEQVPTDAGVRLRFHVQEKWYLLPLPRVEANADGDYGYGAQVRWSNIWGLNHTARLLVVKRDYSGGERQGQLSFSGSYSVPFLDAGNPAARNGMFVSGGHISQDSLDALDRHFDEQFNTAEVQLTHSLASGPRSQGWSIGGGLRWQNESSSGQFAPASQGQATALVGSIGYNQLHYLIFSEEGEAFRLRYELAQDGWLSDYGYSQWTANYRRAWHLGTTPHQEVQLLGGTGSYFGGASSRVRRAFALGGSGMLRGYDSEVLEGDFYYYAAGEYLRPVIWNWLRVVAIAEAGSAYHSVTQTGAHPVLASIGLGLRLRLKWVVNFEFQAGVALPLVDGGGPRIFAGSL